MTSSLEVQCDSQEIPTYTVGLACKTLSSQSSESPRPFLPLQVFGQSFLSNINRRFTGVGPGADRSRPNQGLDSSLAGPMTDDMEVAGPRPKKTKKHTHKTHLPKTIHNEAHMRPCVSKQTGPSSPGREPAEENPQGGMKRHPTSQFLLVILCLLFFLSSSSKVPCPFCFCSCLCLLQHAGGEATDSTVISKRLPGPTCTRPTDTCFYLASPMGFRRMSFKDPGALSKLIVQRTRTDEQVGDQGIGSKRPQFPQALKLPVH